MSSSSRKLQYADRVALQQADQAIRKDVLRALVEVITNSNDSYSRLEQGGERVSGSIEIETLLCGILDRSKFSYIPLEYYDVDRSIVKMLPESLTIARLIVPFDIMSRTVMIATANPFDVQGKEAVQQLLDYHVQWHVASPQAIAKVIGETYRLS